MQVARVAPDWPVPSLMHRRRVLGDRISYVGLDVHKDWIVVAVAEGGRRGEVREYGRIAAMVGGSPTTVWRWQQRYAEAGSRACCAMGPASLVRRRSPAKPRRDWWR